MPRVFISYRHADSLSATGLLHGWLEKEFGKDQVFLDASDIVPGEEFREAIRRFIGTTHVMLLVIGPKWLSVVRDGRRRLDDPDDLLRQEIEWGLEANIPIIPVLIDGVSMPRAYELPKSLRPLTSRTAFVFQRDLPVDQSVKRLVQLIWASSGRRRPLVRRPRLLAFHTVLILSLLSLFLILVRQAGLLSPGTAGLTRVSTGSVDGLRIMSFEADSPVAIQGAALTVRWTAEGASSYALLVDGERQDLLAADATQATLTLDSVGQHGLTLVAFRGENSTQATTQVRVEPALQIRRFAASPSVLTRYIAHDVTLMWDVVGATQIRLSGLEGLTDGVALSTFPPQASRNVRLRLEEQTVIVLEATSASGQIQRQPLILRVEDPICIVSVDQAPVYDSPGGTNSVLEWRSLGEIVVPDNRNADSDWLRVHVAGGQHVWMPVAVLHCRAFEPADLPVFSE